MTPNENVQEHPPAFPVPYTNFDLWCHRRYPVHGYAGMSLRDYFAAKAMQGLLACASGPVFVEEEACYQYYAKQSYGYADAMLAERIEEGNALKGKQ